MTINFAAETNKTSSNRTDVHSPKSIIPANIMDDLYKVNGNNIVKYLKGHKVEVTAKLKAGRDPYFAIMNRPVGKLLPASQGDVCSN